jgi:hypothetical protein
VYQFDNYKKFNSGSDADMLDEHAILLLNKIISATNAIVVISSRWRENFSLEMLKNFLFQKGFIGTVYDKTPNSFWLDKEKHIRSQRGHEIQKWLNSQKIKPISYIILDDKSDMAHLSSRLIQTTARLGLTEKHVELAIKMLNS